MDAGLGHDHAQRECDQVVEECERIHENQKCPRNEKRFRPFPAEEPEDQAADEDLEARVGDENVVCTIPDPIHKKPEHDCGEPRPRLREFGVGKVFAFEPNHPRDREWHQVAMLPVLALPKNVRKMQHGDQARPVAVGVRVPRKQQPECRKRTNARDREFNMAFAGRFIFCHSILTLLVDLEKDPGT